MAVSRPTPQGWGIIWNFIILLDLCYDPEENKVLFVKIEARILDLRLDMSFGPKWYKCSF